MTALFKAESKALFNRGRTMTRDDAASADLVQEVFAAATCSWEELRLRPHEDQMRWLYRVLANRVVDRWRKDRRLVFQADVTEANPTMSTQQDDPAVIVVESIHTELLCKALQAMPPAQYRVIYLAWVEGWTNKEIASEFEISQATVRVHTKNAVDQLRNIGGDDYDYAR